MATARKAVIQSYKVVLELSQQEAEFLRDVMNLIGGHAATTRRKYADAINKALAIAEVAHQYPVGDVLSEKSTIWFV